jgi:exopolysaccharide production protein ExoQ
VISILWSQSPVDTLKYSLEFALTVCVALLFSAAPYPKAVLWGLFLAFAIYIPSAIVFGQAVDVGNNGDTAMSGLTQSKNLLGDMAATGALVSLACFMASMEDRRPFRAIAALAVAATEIYVLLAARSAGALLGMVPAVFAFIFFLALRPARLTMRLIATVFASLAAAVMTIAYGSGVVEDSMTLFEKDPTLTGRTYLWQRAADFIAEKPALGTGFDAFWVQGNPDAEGLWRFAGINERMGFNFHNTLIEWLVNVGWVGVSVLTIVAIISAILMVRRVMTRPTLALCFWLSILIYEFVRMPVEALGMAPFAHPTIMLFTGFGAAMALRQTAAARKAARRVAHYRMRLPRAVFQRGPLRPSRFSV